MTKSARVSAGMPLTAARPASTTMGMVEVSGRERSREINSLPPMRGMVRSVTMRVGCRCSSNCMASAPSLADSTVKPRCSRKRQTVCRISIESSTTRTVRDIKPPPPGEPYPTCFEIRIARKVANSLEGDKTQAALRYYEGYRNGRIEPVLHFVQHEEARGFWAGGADRLV